MIKVSWPKSKGSILKSILKNTWMQKLKNNFIAPTIVVLFSACSPLQNTKTDNTLTNPYPSIMKLFVYKERVPSLIVELEAKSLTFKCSLRNDSPYYWCGIEGNINNPDFKLPKKVIVTFHRVVDKKTKKVAENFFQKLKTSNKPIFLVSPNSYQISNNEFGNLMFGVYNEDVCMDLFRDFEACPKSAKKFDLYSNSYIE